MAPENQQRSFGEDRGEFERARLSLARMQVSGGNSLKEAFERTTETAATTLQVERVGIWYMRPSVSATGFLRNLMASLTSTTAPREWSRISTRH